MKKYTFELWGKKYELITSKPIVVCDLDGTLSDGSHRLHLLPTENLHLTESWREFNRAAAGDSPIKSTIAVINGLWVSGFAIVILTGRSDEVRYETCKWLNENGVKFDEIIMRRQEDNRKDTVIKEEALRAIGLDNIVCAFDDSPNVVKHFRSLGITTYQVTEYDKPHAHIQSHGVESIKITKRARFVGSKDSLVNASFTRGIAYDVVSYHDKSFIVHDDSGCAWSFNHSDGDFVNA
ncbi:polynucleotide kinase [Shigella sonnei]|nr:polynucleotide kinase [Shigella sonnei]